MATQPRRLQELPEQEALRLLSNAPYGRIIFTAGGLPTIRPVIHVLVDGEIVVRTHFGSAALEGTAPVVVAYEADMIDPEERIAWSVIVTGRAVLVTDAEEIGRYEAMLTESWVANSTTHMIRIEPEVITGYAVVKDED